MEHPEEDPFKSGNLYKWAVEFSNFPNLLAYEPLILGKHGIYEYVFISLILITLYMNLLMLENNTRAFVICC